MVLFLDKKTDSSFQSHMTPKMVLSPSLVENILFEDPVILQDRVLAIACDRRQHALY